MFENKGIYFTIRLSYPLWNTEYFKGSLNDVEALILLPWRLRSYCASFEHWNDLFWGCSFVFTNVCMLFSGLHNLFVMWEMIIWKFHSFKVIYMTFHNDPDVTSFGFSFYFLYGIWFYHEYNWQLISVCWQGKSM